MMDVTQARGFAVFEERYSISKARMVKGVKTVSWLSVCSTAFFVAYLAVFVKLPVEQELVGNGARRNVRRADWLSVVSIDL